MTKPEFDGPDTHPPLVRILETERGSLGMKLFILTEAVLFVLLFFSYYYTEKGDWRWSTEEPPKLHFALPMLAILMVSSFVLHWGEKRVRAGEHRRGITGMWITVVLGIVFLILTFFEYAEHLKTLTPQMNAYGSIFYTITTFHGAHLILGLLMMGYVLLLPRIGEAAQPPHKPYHTASMYWHFVDTVWVFIVGLLYIAPHLRT